MSEVNMPPITERRRGIQFDLTINVSSIVAIVVFGWGGFWWLNTTLTGLNNRLIVLETAESSRKEQNALQLAHQAARDAEQRQQMNYLMQRVDALKDAVVKKN